MDLQSEPTELDLQAWQRFCDLVHRGAGVSDSAQAHMDGVPAPNPSDAAYLTGLVDHHQANIIPFLVERCGIRGRSVLDFGSGTGGLSVAILKAGAASVTGVEPNLLNHEASVWRTRAYRLDGRIHPHYVPDTSHLPFPDHSFDVCVCNSVLQYVPERSVRRALLTEMHRVVKPGGIIAVSGSGNGIFPGGPHSTRFWSNLAPDRAARLGHKRGVTYWEIHHTLAPLGASLVPPTGPEDHALLRWRRRVGQRGLAGKRGAAYRLLFAAYASCEATLCRRLNVPIEAFLPFIEIAYRKAPRRAAGEG